MVEALNIDLQPKCFYRPVNQIIFARLIAMLADGKTIDLAVLAEELNSVKQLEAVGGYKYLMEISGSSPTTAKAGYFAQKIKELFTLRETIREATALVETCYEGVEDIQKTLTPAAERLMGLAVGASSDREPTFAELIDKAEEQRVSIITGAGRPKKNVLSFPWAEMDAAFEPMQRGQLVVPGARPSIGKSSLLRQIACYTAMQGHNVYFVTLEVNPVQVVMQMAATLARVGVKELAKVMEEKKEGFRYALHSMKHLGIHLSRRDKTLAQIIAKAKAIHSRTPLSMICVDYGGLIEDIAHAHSKDKITQIGRVTKGLKNLGGDLDAVSVLPWQLNRNSANDGNRVPRLSDLRDSGDVEQDADKVLFIHRPDINRITNNPQPETNNRFTTPLFYQDIIQAKGRDDGTAQIGMYFERSTASFLPIVHSTPAPSTANLPDF